MIIETKAGIIKEKFDDFLEKLEEEYDIFDKEIFQLDNLRDEESCRLDSLGFSNGKIADKLSKKFNGQEDIIINKFLQKVNELVSKLPLDK